MDQGDNPELNNAVFSHFFLIYTDIKEKNIRLF